MTDTINTTKSLSELPCRRRTAGDIRSSTSFSVFFFFLRACFPFVPEERRFSASSKREAELEKQPHLQQAAAYQVGDE